MRALGVVALLAVLLALAVAGYVGSQQRPPEPFGLASNGLVAFTDDGDVFVKEGLGAPPALLNGDPATDNGVIFSPLGDRLLILRAVDGGEDLLVAAADGTGLQRIGGPFASIDWVEWSPDQTFIAISHVARAVPRIDLVPTDGSGGKRLRVAIPAMGPSFRPPDGRSLLFRGQEGGRWGFYLMDLPDGKPVRLDIDGAGIEGGQYDLQAPTWSPAGDRLAFHTLVDLPGSQLATPGFRIGLATIDDAGTVTSTEMLEFDPRSDDELNPIFTPDGRHVVYQERYGWTPPQAGGPEPTVDTLHLFPVDGGPARELGIISRDGEGIGVTPAPDGSAIIAHLWAEAEDWLIDPETGATTLLDLGSTSGMSWQRRGP